MLLFYLIVNSSNKKECKALFIFSIMPFFRVVGGETRWIGSFELEKPVKPETFDIKEVE